MRTTIDLPDDLFRQAKAKAALSGVKLKDLIARYVEQGLRDERVPPAQPRQRSPLPVISKAAASGQPIPALSNAEIQAVLDEEDAEQVLRSAGH